MIAEVRDKVENTTSGEDLFAGLSFPTAPTTAVVIQKKPDVESLTEPSNSLSVSIPVVENKTILKTESQTISEQPKKKLGNLSTLYATEVRTFVQLCCYHTEYESGSGC